MATVNAGTSAGKTHLRTYVRREDPRSKKDRDQSLLDRFAAKTVWCLATRHVLYVIILLAIWVKVGGGAGTFCSSLAC
jgi:hypothetical protein